MSSGGEAAPPLSPAGGAAAKDDAAVAPTGADADGGLVFGELPAAGAGEEQETYSTPLAVTRAPSTVPESPAVAFHSPESPRDDPAARGVADATLAAALAALSSSGSSDGSEGGDAPGEPAGEDAAPSRLLSLQELTLRDDAGAARQGAAAGSASSSRRSSTSASSGSAADALAAAAAMGGGDGSRLAAEALAAAAVAAAAEDAAAAAAPHSPVAGGLDRSHSWQLQHAAAEAAGTAPHPAPPRSDIDLAKLR